MSRLNLFRFTKHLGHPPYLLVSVSRSTVRRSHAERVEGKETCSFTLEDMGDWLLRG